MDSFGSYVCLTHSDTDTHTHIHTHTLKQTNTNTHTHTLSHTHTHTLTHTHTHTRHLDNETAAQGLPQLINLPLFSTVVYTIYTSWDDGGKER